MSDGYTLNEDGTAVFEFSGIIRTLRRPKLGEYRAILESLGEFREEILRAAEAARKAAADGEESTAPSVKIGEQLDKLLTWLDGVFEKLAGEGLPRRLAWVDETGKEVPDGTPTEGLTSTEIFDEDKLEPWLLSGVVVTDLVQHWQTVPSRRGGQ